MSVFVDSSALYAMLDGDDVRHNEAATTWNRLLADEERLFTTNYVLVETTALVQRRLGLRAVRALADTILGSIEVLWIGEVEHRAGMSALSAAGRRDLSLVDCTSFDAMRRTGLQRAFAFDDDFARQGFAAA